MLREQCKRGKIGENHHSGRSEMQTKISQMPRIYTNQHGSENHRTEEPEWSYLDLLSVQLRGSGLLLRFSGFISSAF
jgi:hypothetical protein